MDIGDVQRGDFANHDWGVVDMLAVTDFHDIRLKAPFFGRRGNIPPLPREAVLVRLYVDLGDDCTKTTASPSV